jgi:hypothetical protein
VYTIPTAATALVFLQHCTLDQVENETERLRKEEERSSIKQRIQYTMERVDNKDHPLSSSSSTPTTTPSQNRYQRRRPRTSDMASSPVPHSEAGWDNGERYSDDQEHYQQQQPTSKNHPNTADQNFVARSPAASLIQSAARSALLDEATPSSTVISDDASEVMSGHHRQPYQSSPAHLSSLQTPTLPALPNEQDRRRFIGCLAAVLASSYDYDVAEDKLDEDTGSTATSNNNESVWLGYPDDFWDDDDEVDSSFEEKVDDVSKLPNGSVLSKTHSTASDSFYSTRCQSFESLGTQESSKTTQSGKQHPRRKSRLRRQTESSLHRKSGIFTNNAKEKARLSQERHRHRRYEVLSKLLMSSSELLLLDKTVARAFLPMLSRVLVPECRQLQKSFSGDTMEDFSKMAPKSRSAPSSPSNAAANARALNSSFEGERMLPSNSSSDIPQSTQRFNKSLSYDTTESATAQPLPPMPIENEEELGPFLESLTPGAGFRCVALLLLQHLLTSETGYDARVRHVLKKLSVIVLVHDMQSDPIERHNEQNEALSQQDLMLRAARKFEALEHSVAQRLLRLSNPNAARGTDASKSGKRRDAAKPARNSFTREQLCGVSRLEERELWREPCLH